MDMRGSLRAEGFSVRNMLTFLLVVVVTAFLWVFLGNTTSVSAADANWDGAKLVYDGRDYYGVGKAQDGEIAGIPKDSPHYVSAPTGITTAETQKAYIIYFASGTDPPTETKATHATYDYNLKTKKYSNPSNISAITVDAGSAGTTAGSTSCAIEDVGWAICGISNFLATGMDTLFDMLSGFMEVQPVQTGDTTNGLYVAWNVMRGIANVAFIIVFLVIIYSQITNIGVSNYGLKKLIPRLIIAAILVNMSYIITAIAIDISNILGYSLQDIFMQIREDTFKLDDPALSGEMVTWESIMGFVLSGGTAAAAASVGVAAATLSTGGTIAGLIYLILPLLLGLLLAVLTVLLILAARQAIIVILVILGPLAFVAYLLPNTEKWFDKWRETLTTMLVFFPAFSVVFGGSQLAGAVIIANATSLMMLILGMAVQVAPLIITPLILKFSGSLLGKVAGIINNPNKGILDRTRKWADGNREYHKQRGVSGMGKRKLLSPREMIRQRRIWSERRTRETRDTPGELQGVNWMRRGARSMDQRQRRLGDRTKNASAHADNVYHRSRQYERIHEAAHEIGVDKEHIDNSHATHINQHTSTPGHRLYGKNIALEQGKRALERSKADVENSVLTVQNDKSTGLHVANVELENAKVQLDRLKMDSQAQISAYRAGNTTGGNAGANAARLTALAAEMNQASIGLSASTRAEISGRQAQQQNYAEALRNDLALQDVAAGIDPNGAQRALAEAIAIISKNSKERIENAKTIIGYENITDNEKKDLVKGNDVTLANGNVIRASVDIMMAAAQSLIGDGGSPGVVLDAIKEADFNNPALSAEDRLDLYSNFSEAIKGSKMRPAYVDFKRLAFMGQGLDINGAPIAGPYGNAGMDDIIITSLNNKTLTPGTLQTMMVPYAIEMRQAIMRNGAALTPDAKAELRRVLGIVLDDTRPGYDLNGGLATEYQDILTHL